MTDLIRMVVTTTAIIVSAIAAPAANAAKSSEPIRIAVNQSTSQRVTAHIAGEALRKAGYSVEYVEVSVQAQLAEIAAGRIHVQPEVLGDQASTSFQEALTAGTIVGLGRKNGDTATSAYKKIVGKSAKEKWPGAIKLLLNMSLGEKDQAAMTAEIDDNGRSVEDVVDEWMRANPAKWKRWIAASTNWMKP